MMFSRSFRYKITLKSIITQSLVHYTDIHTFCGLTDNADAFTA